MEAITSRVQDVILWLIEHKYTSSKRELAEQIGYSPSSISLILNGRVKVTPRFAKTLETFSNGRINSDWILTGNGNMVDSENKPYTHMDLEHIIADRNIIEDGLRRQLQEFYKTTGIAIDSIGCSHSIDQDGNAVFDVRIPLSIPSDGSASRELQQEYKQINPTIQEAYELMDQDKTDDEDSDESQEDGFKTFPEYGCNVFLEAAIGQLLRYPVLQKMWCSKEWTETRTDWQTYIVESKNCYRKAIGIISPHDTVIISIFEMLNDYGSIDESKIIEYTKEWQDTDFDEEEIPAMLEYIKHCKEFVLNEQNFEWCILHCIHKAKE